MPTNLEIELVHSTIGCPPDQRATVVGLGLRKLHSKKVLVDTPQVRGMLAKVPHLVAILGTVTVGTTKAKKKS